MRRNVVLLLMVLMLASVKQSFAVSEAAVLFLLLSPSPGANAMGQTYGTTAATSPMAAIMNPASLGFFAQNNYLGHEYYPDAMVWLPQYGTGLTYDARTTAIGINLKQFTHIPVSIGMARSRIFLDLGTQYQTLEDSPEPVGSFSSSEEAEGTTLAVAMDYYLRASIGITWKHIDSILAPFGVGEERGDGRASIDAKDWGLMVQAPLVDLARKSGLLAPPGESQVDFWFDPGFYLSKTNIGDKISYIDAAQADPLPRTLTLGVNLQTGVRYRGLPLAGFSWSREAEDMLVERFEDGSSAYLDTPPDLNFWDHVFRGKSNARIISKRGYELGFAGIYFLRGGRYEDVEGKVFLETSGYGINFLQPLRIAAVLLNLDQRWPMRLLSHLAFEKHHSEYEAAPGHPLAETEMESYVFRINAFPIFR